MLLLAGQTAAQSRSAVPMRPLMGYHESWGELPVSSGELTRLARLPSYVNLVVLSFVKPDLEYAGGYDLSRTGFGFPFPGTVLAEAVRILKQRQPGTRILVSVGGATYGNWRGLNVAALARLVQDFALDGVDIDFEPQSPGCRTQDNGERVCATDRQWRSIVRSVRQALPRPAIVAAAAWSVAAYGEGEFVKAPPLGSNYTGHALGLFRSAEGRDLDLVSIMAYNAPGLDAAQAFRAFRRVWDGPLLLGVLVPPDDMGDAPYTIDRLEALIPTVKPDPLGGFMVYTLQRQAEGGQAARQTPDATLMMQTLCRSLGLKDCSSALP